MREMRRKKGAWLTYQCKLYSFQPVSTYKIPGSNLPPTRCDTTIGERPVGKELRAVALLAYSTTEYRYVLVVLTVLPKLRNRRSP
jgi:hypothetical protein